MMGEGKEEWTPLFRASVELAGPLEGLRELTAKRFPGAFAASRNGDEHSLEQTAAHCYYVERAEEVLQTFLRRHSVSREAFFDECRDSLDGRYCALFQSDINEWFVLFLLGIGDFEAFAEAMRDSPRRKSGGSRSDHK